MNSGMILLLIVGCLLMVAGAIVLYSGCIKPFMERQDKISTIIRKYDEQTKRDYEQFRCIILTGNELEFSQLGCVCVICKEDKSKFEIRDIKSKEVIMCVELNIENYTKYIHDL